MDTRQTLNILDKYWNMVENYGIMQSKETAALAYLMFLDEYYEVKRDISLKNMSDDNIGLTDELVKKLNKSLMCLKKLSCVIGSMNLDMLPSKYHWVIPDAPIVEDEEYIEGSMLVTTYGVTNMVLETGGIINDKILVI